MRKLLTYIITMAGSISLQASTVTANSGSFVDVSNAVTSAGLGGTVWIPPGTNVWNSNLSDNGVNLYGSNNVSILFNGSGGGIGLYITAAGTFVTVSNILFDVNQSTGPGNYCLALDGSNVCFRITHCTFLDPAPSDIGVKICPSENNLEVNGPWGVFDSCTFRYPSGHPWNYINATANGSGDGRTNSYPWRQPSVFGTTNTVDVETCSFYQSDGIPECAAVEALGGASITLRYCNFTNVEESTHGTQSGGGGIFESTKQIEFYNNYIQIYSVSEIDYMYLQRGGSGLIYSNTWVNNSPYGTSGANVTSKFWVECAQSDWQSESCPFQLMYPTNYPGAQQIGQGVLNTGSYGLVPIYMWANNWGSTLNGPYALGQDSDGPFIQQGRDIFTNSVKPSYTPLIYPSPLVGTPVVPSILPSTPNAILNGVRF